MLTNAPTLAVNLCRPHISKHLNKRRTAPQTSSPSHQQLHILEEAQYDKQLLMPSVQKGFGVLQKFLLDPSHSNSVSVLLSHYITINMRLHTTFLARFHRGQHCSMHHLLRLPDGHPFLQLELEECTNWHWNRWSVEVICATLNEVHVQNLMLCMQIANGVA